MRFKSMPNFRRLADGRGAAAPAGAEGDPVVVRLNVFRSSRPDFLTADEIEQFQSAGIRSIIDFRSTTEYRKASGLKLLDRFYPPHKVIESEWFFYEVSSRILSENASTLSVGRSGRCVDRSEDVSA